MRAVERLFPKLDLAFAFFLLCILFLNFISLNNELLFHFMAELYTIIISSCLFAVIWTIRDKIDNSFYYIFATGLLFTAIFDLLHILTFEGMIFVRKLDIDHSLYFWIMARSLQSTTFLIATIRVKKNININKLLLLFALITFLGANIIFTNILPSLFNSDGSFSVLRIVLEIFINLMFLISLILLYVNRSVFKVEFLSYFSISILLTMISEIVITLNTSGTHLVSVIGLDLKVIAYVLLFQIILITGITKPQEIFYLGLRDSWKRLQDLIENLNEGICIIDLKDRFKFSNPAAEKIFGVNIGKLNTYRITDFIIPHSMSVYKDQKEKIKPNKPNTCEIEILNSKQEKRSIVMTASPQFIDDTLAGFFVIIHDITDRKNLEIEFQSLARFSKENPNPVMRILKSGALIYSNQGSEKVLEQWDCHESELVPNEIMEIVQSCLENNEPEILEVEAGKNIISLYFAPIPDLGYVNIYGRDVTELKNVEAKLLDYSKDLENLIEEKTEELVLAQEKLITQERLATMGQLAGSVGHELRNPLAVINNALYILKANNEGVNKITRQYLEIIDQEVASANKIITDLLTFARIKPANLNLTHPKLLVEDVLKKFVHPENIVVKNLLKDDLDQIYIDDKQIAQVVANLVINAYQAMPAGGESIISGSRIKKNVQINFSDTGVGIPHDNLEKIFDPLFTTKLKGIGLGLTVSKILTEINGGTIEVKNTSDNGTTFTLTLPIEKKENNDDELFV